MFLLAILFLIITSNIQLFRCVEQNEFQQGMVKKNGNLQLTDSHKFEHLNTIERNLEQASNQDRHHKEKPIPFIPFHPLLHICNFN